ncbi:MAG: tetratricopeptide repeat protein [Capsulimonadales bacterium]|nr:tetratricopeptide repeat protein [Capsulimonadales bacterium]
MAEGSAAERFAKGVQHKLNGEYDEAERLFRSVIDEQPQNADAYHELGLVYGFRVHDDTIVTLEKAVRLSPNNIAFIISLGKTYAMFGEDDKAKKAFQHVLTLDPFNDEAIKQLDFLA